MSDKSLCWIHSLLVVDLWKLSIKLRLIGHSSGSLLMKEKGAEQQPGTANEDGGNGMGAEPQSIYDQEQRYRHKHEARTMMHKHRVLRTIQMW